MSGRVTDTYILLPEGSPLRALCDAMRERYQTFEWFVRLADHEDAYELRARYTYHGCVIIRNNISDTKDAVEQWASNMINEASALAESMKRVHVGDP